MAGRCPEASFDWPTLVANKEREIARLEASTSRASRSAGGEAFHSRAVLVDAHSVRIEATDRTVTADQILIATGGRPNPHAALPGHEHCIFSNEAFDLPKLPKAIVIAGGGYIAVEFANIFHGLGVETTLVYRGKEILQRFDMDLRRMLHETMEKKGITVLCHEHFDAIAQRPDGRLDAHLSQHGPVVADQVMLAIGRIPNTENLGLEAAALRPASAARSWSTSSRGPTSATSGRSATSPTACNSRRSRSTRRCASSIPPSRASRPRPTIGRSRPPCSRSPRSAPSACRRTMRPSASTTSRSIGPSSARCATRCPAATSSMLMKLVVDADTRLVLGAHVLGPDAGEMAQLLGIALKAGLTKDDFDRTMAVHPTAAEELVTMYHPTYRVRNGLRA